MKNKSIIAVGIFGVLLIAFFLTRETRVVQGVKSMQLPQFTAEQVQSIEVSGTYKVHLERSASGWLVASLDVPDTKHAADESLVQSTLEALVRFRAVDLISEREEKHAEYEVDADKGTTIKVGIRDKQTLELVLGKASRRGGAFVRKADENIVFLTTSNLPGQLRRDLKTWRDKKLSIAPASNLAGITFTHADGHTFTMEADDKNAWHLAGEAPKGYRFSPAIASQLVTQLTSLRAQDFLENESSDFPLLVRLQLKKKDTKTITMTLGEKRPDDTFPLTIENNPEVVTVASWVAEQLNKRLEDFRDLSLLNFDVQQVTSLSIQAGEAHTIVEKKDGAWVVVQPEKLPSGVVFDPTQVPMQLARLSRLNAKALATEVTLQASGLAKPSLVLTVQLKDTNTTQRLSLGASTGDEVYAQGALDDLTYLLPASEKASLSKGVALFTPQAPPSFPSQQDKENLQKLPPDLRRQVETQWQTPK